MASTEVAIIDFSEIPLLEDGKKILPTWYLLVQDNESLAVWRATETQLKAALSGGNTATLPTVALAKIGSATVGTKLSLFATPKVVGSSVAEVSFYLGSRRIGRVYAAPFSVDYTPNSGDVGEQVFSAQVLDSLGNSGTSNYQTVTIKAAPLTANQRPTVTLRVSPTPAVLNQPISLQASARDDDGSISKVEFFNYSDKIGELTASPFTLSYTPLTLDTLVLSAKAWDDTFSATQTEGIVVKVVPADGEPTPPDSTVAGPTYVGAVTTPTPTTSQMQVLGAQQYPKAARELHISCNDAYPAFAEPASYGIRSVILDKNGFNITGDVVRTAITLTVNGSALAYNQYVHQNAQFDPDFILAI